MRRRSGYIPYKRRLCSSTCQGLWALPVLTQAQKERDQNHTDTMMFYTLTAVLSVMTSLALAQINLRGLDLVAMEVKSTFCDDEVKMETRLSRMNECIFKSIPPTFMSLVKECREQVTPNSKDADFINAMCNDRSKEFLFADCMFNRMISPSSGDAPVATPAQKGGKDKAGPAKENRIRRQLNRFGGGRSRPAGNRGIVVSDTSPLVLFLKSELMTCRERFP